MRRTAVAVSVLTLLAATSTQLVAAASTSAPSRCRLGHLSVHLGPAGHAAGSTYRPIVFSNTSDTVCTLRGYPGVAYVAPTSGRQIGAAASRDDALRTRTVTLAPGGHAAALLQLVNPFNYPAADCAARTVSGLRVYPPGSTTAAYVAFAHHHKACSSNVHQLAVRVVIRGKTGE
jgi:Protein of unknown function (DUF4232)